MEIDSVAADKRGARRYRIEGLEGRIPLVAQVEIVNISLSGVALKVDRHLRLGSECTLQLQQGDDGASMRGTVVWSSLTSFRRNGEESAPEYSVGIRFSDEGEAPRALVQLLDQNRAFKEQQLEGCVETAARGRAMVDKARPFHVRLLSLTGMLIEMDVELDIDDSYVMIVRLDDTTFLHVTGTICSQFERAPDCYEIGVLLTDVSAGDRVLLSSYLQSLGRENQ
jgi:hypothetical protein